MTHVSVEDGRDDTRLRIFFVLALFAAAFVCAALAATRAALFPSFAGAAPGAAAERPAPN